MRARRCHSSSSGNGTFSTLSGTRHHPQHHRDRCHVTLSRIVTHAVSPASLSWLRDSGAWHEASICQPRASAKTRPLLPESAPAQRREHGENPTLDTLGIADNFNSETPSWCINKTFRLSKNWVELWVGITVRKTTEFEYLASNHKEDTDWSWRRESVELNKFRH